MIRYMLTIEGYFFHLCQNFWADFERSSQFFNVSGTVAWLRRMAVDGKHQQRGVGSALVDVVVDHCKEQNFNSVELITSEHHEKARLLKLLHK